MASKNTKLMSELDNIIDGLEGFALVPVEPTRGMLDAGMYAPTATRSPSDTAELIYKAMIKAAKE
tara:strand:+ start:2496 stop:2690 length:195 start_codon:yes stop_codon:yes gene_type:complete